MTRQLARWLVFALIFTIPWEKSLVFPRVGSATQIVGIAALVFAGVAALAGRKIRPGNLVLVWAASFVVWSALTWLWSVDPPATFTRARTLVQLFAMAYLVWDQCRTIYCQRQAVAAYVAGAAVAASLTIVRYLEQVQTYYHRYAAPGFDPNDLGLTVALAIPLALYLLARSRRPWAVALNAAALVLVLVAILLTASRTALITAYIAFLFCIWIWRAVPPLQRVVMFTLAAVLIAGTVWLAPVASRQRLSTIGTELTQGTLHNRTRIWKAGLKVLRQHAIQGIGAGAYPAAVEPSLGVPGIAGHEYVAHNTFLSVLVETGFLGFGLYAALLGTLALFVYFMRDAERALWSVMLAVWTVGVCTLTWEHRKPGWLVFALITTDWARAFSPQDPA